jgi:hypothetical protein
MDEPFRLFPLFLLSQGNDHIPWFGGSVSQACENWKTAKYIYFMDGTVW